MTTGKLSTLASAVALALAAGCSSGPSSTSRDSEVSTAPGRIESASTQQTGRVSDIQVVQRDQRIGAGAVLGAVIGAAVGSQVGSGSGKTAATGAGAVGGAVLGHQIQKRRADDVYRVSVRFDNGASQHFDFDRIDDLRIGDRVRYDGRQLYRVS